jgi:hypothetical protein
MAIKAEDISGQFQHLPHGGTHPCAAMRHFKNLFAHGCTAVPLPPLFGCQQQQQQQQHHFQGNGHRCGGGNHTAPAPVQPSREDQLIASGCPRLWAPAVVLAFGDNETKVAETLSSFAFDAASASVDALAGMGFAELDARIALLNCAGDMTAALDRLLQ